MRRAKLNLVLDLLSLLAGVVVFGSGTVFLLHFHAGHGLEADPLALGRLGWLNLHRLSAAVLVALLSVHIALHWRALVARVRRGPAAPHGGAELVLYGAIAVAVLTGLVAWTVLPSSTPLFGLAAIGDRLSGRHAWIDVHNLTGVLAGVLTARHVAHRWAWMVRMIMRGAHMAR